MLGGKKKTRKPMEKKWIGMLSVKEDRETYMVHLEGV